MIGKVVSEAEKAFVEGRDITEASLIANAVIGFCKKQGRREALQPGHRKGLWQY